MREHPRSPSRHVPALAGGWRFLPLIAVLAGTLESAEKFRRQPEAAGGRLSTGDAVSQPLTGGQDVAFEASVGAGWYLQFSVEATGVDVTLALLGPGGEEVRQLRARRDHPTPVSLGAPSQGVYTLSIHCDSEAPTSGRLTVRLVETRPAVSADAERLKAETLFSEAEELRLLYDLLASQRAIAKYEAALNTWEGAGDPREAALASQRMGALHEQLGAQEQALEFYRRALRLAGDAGDDALQSEMLSELGVAEALSVDAEQGLERCERARSLARSAGSVRGEARGLTCLGEVEYHRGDLAKALDLYARARRLSRDALDREGEARATYLLGVAHSDQSQYERAKDRSGDALALWRAIGDRRGEALTLVALGRLDDRLGAYQDALNYFQEAMQLVEPMGDPLWQASLLTGVANVYRRMGDTQEAARHWRRAQEHFRTAGVQLAVADVLMSVGEMDLALGDDESALSHFRESLALSEELENQRFQAWALRFIGLTHQARGDSAEALDHYRRAAALQSAGEDRLLEAYLLADLGGAYEDLGRLDLAVDHFRRAVELSRSTRDQLGEAMGLYELARVRSAQSDLMAARELVEESLRLAESLRTRVASHALRASYLASIHQRYELHIDTLMRLARAEPGEGYETAALEASERARARSLLESLAEASVGVRGGVDPGLLEREQRLERTLDGKAERLMRLLSGSASSDEAIELEQEVRDLTSRYEQVRAEIRSKSPRYAALTQPQPLRVAEIQEQVLDADTLLLEYSLGERRSYLWVASAHSLASYELPPRATIEVAVREVHGLLTARLPLAGESLEGYRRRVEKADRRYWPSAAQLAEVLLGPVAAHLPGKRLLVVADGALQYLPFGALPTPGRVGDPVPLAVEHEIVHEHSASALALLRRETAGRGLPVGSVAVLADPVFEADDPRVKDETGGEAPLDVVSPGPVAEAPALVSGARRALREVGVVEQGGGRIPRLVATRREADAIVSMAPPGTSFWATGFDASLATARSRELGRYRFLHFATHGIVNSENPDMSGIILSLVDAEGRPQNGFLRLQDIYNLELPVELVVLSACSSALGKDIRGEGLVGIARGFMYAGAKRVLASLWRVDDQATGELMSRFYRHLLQGELSPAAALQQAQTEMWQTDPWRSPFYWAGFVLQGEWS